jgi:hypothetical protein
VGFIFAQLLLGKHFPFILLFTCFYILVLIFLIGPWAFIVGPLAGCVTGQACGEWILKVFSQFGHRVLKKIKAKKSVVL